jgi:hypothetical protein
MRLLLALLTSAVASAAGCEGCSCEPAPPPGDDAGPPTPTTSLVAPAGSTACEGLAVEDGVALVVSFADGTRGTSVREAPRVAL